MSTNPKNLSIEEYIHVQYCCRCYAIGDHLVRNCPYPEEYKICSNCMSTEHTHKDCPTPEIKKCVNCQNSAHHTLAFGCPKRKNYVASKSKQVNSDVRPTNVPIFSYSDATKTNLSTSQDIKTAQILVAVSAEITKNSSSFGAVLNSLLQENNLPSVKLESIDQYLYNQNSHFIETKLPENLNTPKFTNSKTISSGISFNETETTDSISVQSPSTRQQSSPPTNPDSALSKSPTVSPPTQNIQDSEDQSILIFRRSDLIKEVTRKNIRKLAGEGKIMVSCDHMDEVQCITYLCDENNNTAFFKNILTLPIDIFNKKLNSNLNSSSSIRKSKRVNKH